jgi:predicted lactoylglutathione lyase
MSALSIVTLGVADVGVSRRFYAAAFGWTESPISNPHIAFFDTGGPLFAVFSRQELAKDAGVPNDGDGFRGVSCARNFASQAVVDAAFVQAVSAGAKPVKSPQSVFWGGYSSYVADPDGHLWELAWNPFFQRDDHGNVSPGA